MIAIKGITEAIILGRKEFCDEYIRLGIHEWILEGFKEVSLIGIIEITMLGINTYSKLWEELGCKEDARLAIFL